LILVCLVVHSTIKHTKIKVGYVQFTLIKYKRSGLEVYTILSY